MAPLIFMGFGAIAAYNIYRFFSQEWIRINEALDDVTQSPHGSNNQNEPITLIKDPVTGEYRSKQ